MVRLTDASVIGNPWRIAGLKAEMVWASDVPLHQLADDYAEHFKKESNGV